MLTRLRARLREARAAHAPPYAEIVREAEHHPELFAEVAGAFWEAGRLREALLWLERALFRASADEHARLLVRVGAARIRLGELREAVDTLGAFEPDDAYGALQLGNALRYLGRYEEAQGYLERAWARAKATGDGALAVAVLCAQGEGTLDQGKGQAATELFGRALGVNRILERRTPHRLASGRFGPRPRGLGLSGQGAGGSAAGLGTRRERERLCGRGSSPPRLGCGE